jgi:isoleucyl-tRNA synthetase
VKISYDLLKQISETYRKIRNTARYILGNLSGFNPDTDLLDVNKLADLDKLALCCFDTLTEEVLKSYENFDFYRAYHAINNFCVVEMSNFYLDVIKDRLYCEKADGELRRSAQTAMFIILHGLTKLIAPILCYTADEIWAELPKLADDDMSSVVFNDMPGKTGVRFNDEFVAKWDKVVQLRNEVMVALEQKRAEKIIGKSLEAKVILKGGEDLSDILPELAATFIVSQVELEAGGDTLEIIVQKADGAKCARCWIYSTSVGEEELCDRCARVVKA